jgi:hypothetical protein
VDNSGEFSSSIRSGTRETHAARARRDHTDARLRLRPRQATFHGHGFFMRGPHGSAPLAGNSRKYMTK